MNRRKLIKGMLALTALGLPGFYSWQIEPFWLEFVKKKMPVKNLPAHLVNRILMQISDLHVGNRFDRNYIVESLRKARLFEPDFVVYTGDYISYENDQQIMQLKEVMETVVKGRIGTVGILGNHDYGKNWSQKTVANAVTELLTESGILMLRNERKDIEGIDFIGLDDYWATNFYPQTVMSDVWDPDKAHLVLCHNPDVCDLDVWSGYRGWILSGHTHGGQCKPPFLDPPMLPVKNKRYSAGEIDLGDGRTLYINRALGHLWQIRFNVRPEITLFQLVRA